MLTIDYLQVRMVAYKTTDSDNTEISSPEDEEDMIYSGDAEGFVRWKVG